jgi:hypothetical protein
MVEIRSRGEEVKLQGFDEKLKAGNFLGVEGIVQGPLDSFSSRLVSLSPVDFND